MLFRPILFSLQYLLSFAATGSMSLLRVKGQDVRSTLQSVADVKGFAYLLDVQIGERVFPLLLDTGSSDLWVVSANCTGPDCAAVRHYAPSSDLNLTSIPFGLKYLAGSVAGTVAYESISVGRFCVMNQVLALANDVEGLDISGTGNAGIVGLAFPRTASISPSLGFGILWNIFGVLPPEEQFFSVRLGKVIGGSTFNVGSHDPQMEPALADMSFHNVVPMSDGRTYDYWKVQLHGIILKSSNTSIHLSRSKLATSKSAVAVLDTGTTLILGPSRDVERLWIAAGGARRLLSGDWQVRCDVAITLGFVFDTRTFFLDPADISWNAMDPLDGWCIGGIQANDQVIGGDWLLGDTFLRSVYTAYFAPTPRMPPRIGMLNLTDPDLSSTSFYMTRGSSSPIPPTEVTGHGSDLAHRYQVLVLSFSVVGGCLAGIGWIAYREGGRRGGKSYIS